MTALTTDRNTPSRSGDGRTFPVAAATKIYAGAIVCLNATALAVPGATATGLVAVGRARAQVDNSAGAASARNVDVDVGIFRFANSTSTDAIADTDIGSTAYIVDDQTVAKTNGGGTRSVAGKVFKVDAIGVWIAFA